MAQILVICANWDVISIRHLTKITLLLLNYHPGDLCAPERIGCGKSRKQSILRIFTKLRYFYYDFTIHTHTHTHTHTSILNLHLMVRFTMELDIFGDKIFLLI